MGHIRAWKKQEELVAQSVALAEADKDPRSMKCFWLPKDLPIGIRLKACFHIPLDPDNPLIPEVRKTVEEYNGLDRPPSVQFPETWVKLVSVHLFSIVPSQLRIRWFYGKYPTAENKVDDSDVDVVASSSMKNVSP